VSTPHCFTGKRTGQDVTVRWPITLSQRTNENPQSGPVGYRRSGPVVPTPLPRGIHLCSLSVIFFPSSNGLATMLYWTSWIGFSVLTLEIWIPIPVWMAQSCNSGCSSGYLCQFYFGWYWRISWSAASQLFIRAPLLVGYTALPWHLSSVLHARGSLRSCTCVPTCHRGSVPDSTLRKTSYFQMGGTLTIFCHISTKQDSLQLTPQYSVFTQQEWDPYRLSFSVHLTHLLRRPHIAPSLSESIVTV
jgi:hypothetical protein